MTTVPITPEVWYHGCDGRPGHDLHSKKRMVRHSEQPWGLSLDSGLLVSSDEYYGCDSTPRGEYKVAQKDGWTAVAFWDRSGGDTRPGCNSVFLVHAIVTGEELLSLARSQWPEIFSRRNFPIKAP